MLAKATAGKRKDMAGDTSRKSQPPDWYEAGLDHVWLPYAQMKTAALPLPVVAHRRLAHRAR